MQLPYSEELNIECLGRLFDKRSECYKFFWFKAIVGKVLDGRLELSYEELVDEMIADAWYMVTEYHLNLGPKDSLESLVHLIKEKYPQLKSSEKKSVLLGYLKDIKDKDIIREKRTLTRNVPYRLQSPFMPDFKGKVWDVGENKLIAQINQKNRLMYYFNELNGLSTQIIVQEDWARYIKKNQEIIKGWLEYHMIQYIQKRNPNVPGIADKLYPPEKRKLDKVKKYWKLILSIKPIHEIYGDNLITAKNLSIDHFVPWSYVAHDELWNLNPTTKNINSAKSNNLPDWDSYFNKLVEQEYQAYQLMWQYDSVYHEFEECAKDHVNNQDVLYRVYRKDLKLPEFSGELKSIILPVYQSAKNCGFHNWKYEEKCV